MLFLLHKVQFVRRGFDYEHYEASRLWHLGKSGLGRYQRDALAVKDKYAHPLTCAQHRTINGPITAGTTHYFVTK